MLAANATDSDVVIFFESVRLRRAINTRARQISWPFRGRAMTSRRLKVAGLIAATSVCLRSSEWKDGGAAVPGSIWPWRLPPRRGYGKAADTGRPKCRSRGRHRDVRIWRGHSCRRACETLVYHFEPRKLPCGNSQHPIWLTIGSHNHGVFPWHFHLILICRTWSRLGSTGPCATSARLSCISTMGGHSFGAQPFRRF
jgi:hypothetical protein